MKNKFIEAAEVITDIILCCLVPAGQGSANHYNRASHGLALNMGGTKKYAFKNGKTITVNPFDLIYLPKYSYYTVNTDTPGDTYCINFQIDNDGEYEPFSMNIKNPSDAVTYYRKAVEEWKKKGTGYKCRCKAQLYNVMAEIEKYCVSPYVPGAKAKIAEDAASYIRDNYADSEININMKELSQNANISYEYFRRIFENVFGVSPVKYLNKLRIDRAKELLNSGMYTVADVAFQSGFSDISYFSRFFKKETGLSPSEYKKVRITY